MTSAVAEARFAPTKVAALALGANGVWTDTWFIATPEACAVSEYRGALD